jgi:hypothetical protein
MVWVGKTGGKTVTALAMAQANSGNNNRTGRLDF